MAESKIEAPDKRQKRKSAMDNLAKDGKKRQSSAYVPTIKNFLLVILVFILLTALSWIAYYKFGWFQ